MNILEKQILDTEFHSEVHPSFYIDKKIWKIRNAPFIPAYSGGFEHWAYFHVKFVTQRENTDVKYPFPFSEGVIRRGRSP